MGGYEGTNIPQQAGGGTLQGRTPPNGQGANPDPTQGMSDKDRTLAKNWNRNPDALVRDAQAKARQNGVTVEQYLNQTINSQNPMIQQIKMKMIEKANGQGQPQAPPQTPPPTQSGNPLEQQMQSSTPAQQGASAGAVAMSGRNRQGVNVQPATPSVEPVILPEDQPRGVALNPVDPDQPPQPPPQNNEVAMGKLDNMGQVKPDQTKENRQIQVQIASLMKTMKDSKDDREKAQAQQELTGLQKQYPDIFKMVMELMDTTQTITPKQRTP